jgi:hypothetical protein
MPMIRFVACFRLNEYANVRHGLEAASHDEARNEAHRLAALVGLDLLWVQPDDEPGSGLPRLVPAERADPHLAPDPLAGSIGG